VDVNTAILLDAVALLVIEEVVFVVPTTYRHLDPSPLGLYLDGYKHENLFALRSFK
jgi:hypothetical protein